MTQEELIEQLAALQHENWTHWMKIWFFTRCVDNLDGSVTVPDHLVMQWKNHVMHSYADMADSAREPYRDIATHILSVIEAYEAQSPSQEERSAMELIDWRLGAIKETAHVLQDQLDGLLRQPEPSKDLQFWIQKFKK